MTIDPMRLRARHYRTGRPIDVTCVAGRVAAVEPAGGPADLWVAPALFDLQINGCLGRAFVSPALTIDDVRAVVDRCRSHGISGMCPTLITGPTEALAHGFATLRRACEEDDELDRALPCFHLEGPYISPEDGPRGAHPKPHVRPPDLGEFRRWQDAAGGRIRLVTLSPEYEGSLAFIESLVRDGAVVAIGHTAASTARIRDAVAAGARLSTHLGNGSHALLPRHDNYVWEQLADDRLVASFIPDGHHLPPALLRCLVRVKTPARLVITCDASSLAGLPPGRYPMWGSELEVQAGGKVVVPGTTFLAGSGVFTDDCVRTLVGLGDVSVADALDMAGANPRTLLGLPGVCLEPGSQADLIVFGDAPFRVVTTIVAGRGHHEPRTK
jgi:N-acetylglucosamine-6-phosphate deacetylase